MAAQGFKGKKPPIKLNIPQGDMDVNFITTFYNTERKLSDLIFDLESPNDFRVPILTEQLISLITDDEIYAKVRLRYDSILEAELKKAEEENKGSPLSAEKKAKIELKVCMFINHEVVAFFDQFTGITHRLTYVEI